jgi:protein SCO1/2
MLLSTAACATRLWRPFPALFAILVLAIALCPFRSASAQAQNFEYPEVEEITYGGPFTLLSHDGKEVTEQDFLGSYMLLYFGYTHCPDVCPTGLQNLANAMLLLDDAAEQVQPLFITVDPARDTQEILADYVPLFHPKLLGLTGTPKQIHEAAESYLVHYTIVNYQGEILVGHTSNTYLTDPEGNYVTSFGHGTPPQEIADAVLEAMAGTLNETNEGS